MTILHLDGFDGASDQTAGSSEADTAAYLEARYTTPTFDSDGPIVYTGWGGTGKALAFGSGNGADNNYIRKTIPETEIVVIGFAFRPHIGISINTPQEFLRLRHDADGVVHTTLHLVAGRHILYTRGSSVVLGEVYNAVHLGRWSYIELKVRISETIGTVDLVINGINRLSVSGVDTRFNGNGDDLDTVEFLGIDGDGTADDLITLYDDFYILDTAGSSPVNDFLGPTKIEELLPDGGGDDTDWTPSTGNNFENVDETPRDDDTTYNTSSTTTDLDLFTAGNLAKIDGTVFAVQLDVLGRVTDAGTFTLVPTVKSSTTEAADGGTVISNQSDFISVPGIFEQDPDAAAAWTPTTVNAMQIGYEVG